jgi:ribosome-dependent ATPase
MHRMAGCADFISVPYYYMHASVGAFTKALGPRLLAGDVLALALFIPVLTVMIAAALKGQES